jgi:hypothetical protein
MREQQATESDGSVVRTNSRIADRQKATPVLLRSYDHQCAYDVHIEIVDDGETLFESRYYLQPVQTKCETRSVPDGTYDVHVSVDNTDSAVMECRLDSTVAHTAVIEVGNGTFALSEGLAN